MSHYGTLKETRFANASEDIRGSHLYGLNDEKLGKIHWSHPLRRCRYGWLAHNQRVPRSCGRPARLGEAYRRFRGEPDQEPDRKLSAL